MCLYLKTGVAALIKAVRGVTTCHTTKFQAYLSFFLCPPPTMASKAAQKRVRPISPFGDLEYGSEPILFTPIASSSCLRSSLPCRRNRRRLSGQLPMRRTSWLVCVLSYLFWWFGVLTMSYREFPHRRLQFVNPKISFNFNCLLAWATRITLCWRRIPWRPPFSLRIPI